MAHRASPPGAAACSGTMDFLTREHVAQALGLVAFLVSLIGYTSASDRRLKAMMTVGLVFLAITLGYVGWSVWLRVLVLWPVLLIVFGISMLASALKLPWLRVFGSIAVIGVLVYAVVAAPAGSWTWGTVSGEEFEFTEPVGTATSARIEADLGLAQTRIRAGDELVEASGVTPFGEPRFSVERGGPTVSTSLELPAPENYLAYPGAPTAEVELGLSPDLPWEIAVDVGVASVDADLSGIGVRKFELSSGVADADIRLGPVAPGVQNAKATVSSGIATAVLRIPEDTEAMVRLSSGIGVIDAEPDAFGVGGAMWKTAGYDEAKQSGRGVWDVEVSSGIGTVRVERY